MSELQIAFHSSYWGDRVEAAVLHEAGVVAVEDLAGQPGVREAGAHPVGLRQNACGTAYAASRRQPATPRSSQWVAGHDGVADPLDRQVRQSAQHGLDGVGEFGLFAALGRGVDQGAGEGHDVGGRGEGGLRGQGAVLSFEGLKDRPWPKTSR
ncbi:hypothetical protein [Streptomyces sp. V4I2]|uniref:hypothetical protein n=1 Tax=Streptomyces sp. V4I2 TaxID=3042280 RepID=UPI002789CA96|nr:hypothetical protein [Streptomyces sp. V4I2]